MSVSPWMGLIPGAGGPVLDLGSAGLGWEER